jgi:hypothetical protein
MRKEGSKKDVSDGQGPALVVGMGPEQGTTGRLCVYVVELGHHKSSTHERLGSSGKVVGQDGLLHCSKQPLAPHRCSCFTSLH